MHERIKKLQQEYQKKVDTVVVGLVFSNGDRQLEVLRLSEEKRYTEQCYVCQYINPVWIGRSGQPVTVTLTRTRIYELYQETIK